MGLWLNETLIGHPARLDVAVQDLASSGYGILRVMLRNTNFTHRSPEVVAAVAQVVETSHAFGMKVALDCEPHTEPVARDLGSLYPGAIGCRVVRAEGKVVDGRWVLHTSAPQGQPLTDFLGVHAAFLNRNGAIEKLTGLDFQHRVIREFYQDGYTTSSFSYTEGRPGKKQMHVHLSGKLPGISNGQIAVYLQFSDPRLIDFWCADTWKYFDELLDCYHGIPLDGVGWDEPAGRGDWEGYLFGAGCEAAFNRIHGGHLRDKWFLLDEPGMTVESLQVRLDYYRMLNEGVFEAQRRLIAKAQSLFGDSLLLGTHHTWQGEGGINDYRSGAVDYFRLNDQMDAGYTDCWWWDYKSVCYAYTLGSSLGRLTPSGEAEVNTWDKKPTVGRTEFQARLMTLLNITWFNIWYGRASDCCLFPADYTWPAMVREMQLHRDRMHRIGRAKPVVEVAILHGWETVCGINRADYAAAHKAFCLNTAELFVEHSVAFDWVDARLLAESHIEGKRLVNALGNYSVLVLPYASVLPALAWEKCAQFVQAGGRVIFTGPPPAWTVEGVCLEDEFAEMMGLPGWSLVRYLNRIDAVCTLPKYRPDRLDVVCELTGEPERVLVSTEGERHGITNMEGNAVYLSDLDPRERLMDVIEPWLKSEVTCWSDTILWRLYREETRDLLICVAREGRRLRGLVRWGKEEIELDSGTAVLLEKRNGKQTLLLECRELEQVPERNSSRQISSRTLAQQA